MPVSVSVSIATPTPEPFCREAGSGLVVVCLHSNASSSAQWRGLIELPAPRFHVVAFDLHGAGTGSWDAIAQAHKPAIAESIRNVSGLARSAVQRFPRPLAAFANLQLPVLYLLAAQSRASAHAVARRLTATLPQVQVHTFADMGHMGPLTHAAQVNRAIPDFLDWMAPM